jgi:hypothetical protein
MATQLMDVPVRGDALYVLGSITIGNARANSQNVQIVVVHIKPIGQIV